MTEIITAAPVVEKAVSELQLHCDNLKKAGIHPLMKVILVGEHRPSLVYTANKKRFCERFGAKCDIVKLSVDVKKEVFFRQIENMARDDKVHGCFVQLPLPEHLAKTDFVRLIPPHKDVDGMGAVNFFQLACGDKGKRALLPCTPKGIISLLHHYKIPISGKNVVIVGRSMIVGRPMALLFSNYDATVTLCHSKTVNLPEITKTADILVLAVGKANLIDSSYIEKKRKTFIVDAGINNIDGKLCGDVNYEDVFSKVAGITPVPGGVGPMTILSLARNFLQAAQNTL
ncbi:MAG: bifunctional methylenetetrahydrofolate dehydrogenase/methenyltetrahydrofolate cyclohydrolase [Halobacteriovoraceae bacterium]|nr:bifunctional methylenetetrahydrofolate dehydrogenase/methenyltetrahydrofolate cyclohydrolase [Halobacteriovoraceae bacterium]